VIFDLQDDIMALLVDVPAEVFDPRYETIYLPTLVRGTFRWIRSGLAFTLTHHYFLSFLASTRPKIVLTIIDNNRALYTARMASADEEARFVIFQNGNRLLSEFPSQKSLLPGDVFFCLTDAYVEPLKGSVAGDALIVPSGSLASKLHKLHDLPISQGNTAGYISNWRQGSMLEGELWVTDNHGAAVPHCKFYKPEIDLLQPLLQSIQSLGMTLEIIGASSDNRSEEYFFYESILGKEGWSFSPRIGKERSYSKIRLYPILFCVDSTLGYEALSGLKRVIFLDASSGGENRAPFGYPSNLELANSPLHLRNEALRSWKSQIAQVVSMNDPDFTVLADSIVGQAAISIRLVDLSQIVRAILRPGFNGGS